MSVQNLIFKANEAVRKGAIFEAYFLYQSALSQTPRNEHAKKALDALSARRKGFVLSDPSQHQIAMLIKKLRENDPRSTFLYAKKLNKDHPNSIFVLTLLGVTAVKLDEPREAIKAFLRVIFLKPDNSEAYNNLGIAFRRLGNYREALDAFQAATMRQANYAEAYNNIGITLKDQGKLNDAIKAYKEAINRRPDYAEAHFNMGNGLRELGKLKEAIKAYNQALKYKPSYSKAHNNKGLCFQALGMSKIAKKSFASALKFNPKHVGAHRNLSSLIHYSADDPQIKTVKNILRNADLTDTQRCELHFTLGKMLEDLRNFSAAFEHYSKGGKLKKKMLKYNFEQDKAMFAKIARAADQIQRSSLGPTKYQSPRIPIFILGMPRSGTTLVEQIISSHSSVFGSGELPFVKRFGEAISLGEAPASQSKLAEFRSSYLQELEKLPTTKPIITDKMPLNFLRVPLIIRAFPEAKIIHTTREPAAICWSNFKNYFSSIGLGYSYNLKDTVQFFRLYKGLMERWDEMFPKKIYRLDYELLTTQQEIQTKALINWLNLPWEDACLYPEKNARIVDTVSQQQVREKIYKGSSLGWQSFADDIRSNIASQDRQLFFT